MTGHINRLIMRLHTAATEALPMNDAASWTIQRGLGGLEQISITKIANPFPVVKSSPVDVPCANGALDMAEADGVVYYKNKTVEIVMQTLSLQKPWFSALRDAFAPLNGRMVDFAFDLPTEAEWYYTGRLTIDQCDESTGTLGLKIDTYPFLHSVERKGADIPTVTSLDREACGWTVAYNPSGATVMRSANTLAAYGTPGSVIRLSRAASAAEYTLAATRLVGGDFRFSGAEGDRVRGVAEGGWLYAELTIDGSYYDWINENGAQVYKPCVHLDYILTELPDAGVIRLPSNVQLRPGLFNLETCAADMLLDGRRIALDANSPGGPFPAAVLPGRRADRSGAVCACCVTAVGNSAYDTPLCRITYREEKLG